MSKFIICHKIEFAILPWVASTTSDTINLNAGYALKILKTESATMKETRITSAAGDRVKQNLKLITTEPDELLSLRHQPFIMRIKYGDGKVKVYGSLKIPVDIDPVEGNSPDTNISFTRSGLDFEFQS